jgi:hypothetical protein
VDEYFQYEGGVLRRGLQYNDEMDEHYSVTDEYYNI